MAGSEGGHAPETVLVTGAAGFIGFHVASALLARGDRVVVADNLNPYYDVTLKEARVAELTARAAAGNGTLMFHRIDIADDGALSAIFADEKPARVIHLAAQAGVRHSLTDPQAYVSANIAGFVNLLEACRRTPVQHLTYASTSSVYGANRKLPFREGDGVDHPLQLYAATKRANELMAHSYSHLFQIPTSGLRFFTVYGPWGRPDIALFKFTEAILDGRPIEVFNHGNHSRDFTYVSDVVEAVVRVSDRPAVADPAWQAEAPDPGTSNAPFRIYNVGNNAPARLNEYIAALETALGRTANKIMLPLQPGDVPDTYADTTRLRAATEARPSTPIETGVAQFVSWYRKYYRR